MGGEETYAEEEEPRRLENELNGDEEPEEGLPYARI